MIRRLIPPLCFLLLLGACGRKTPVKPPELAAPERITDLRANNKKTGIRLAWERPETYADGSRMRNLGGFRIERAERDGALKLLTEILLDDQQRFRQIKELRYLDASVETEREYRYRVLSFTLDDYVSKPSNEVWIRRAIPTPPAEDDERQK